MDILERIELFEKGDTVVPDWNHLPKSIEKPDRKQYVQGFLSSISKTVKGKVSHDLSFKTGKITYRVDLEKDAKVIANRLERMFKSNFKVNKWKGGGWYVSGNITDVVGGKRPDIFKNINKSPGV